MKKVIILSICLILIFIFSYKKNVYASSDVINTLVITESDSDYDLNIPGYKILTSTVNSKIVGEYFVVYQNYQTKEEVLRKVKVVSKNDLNNRYFTVDDEKLLVDDMKDVLKYYVLSDNEVILTKEKKKTQVGQDEPKSDFYILLQRNNEIVFESLIMDDCYGTIIEIKVVDNIIYILGTRYFVPSGLDFFVAKYDFNGNRLYIKYLGGNLNENPKTFEVIDKNVYVIGDTLSKRGDIISDKTGTETFITKLDERLYIKKTILLSSNLNDMPLASILVNDFIYIVKHEIDEQIYFPTLSILKIDKDLNIIKDKIIDQGFNHQILDIINDDNSVIITRQKDDDITKDHKVIIESFDEELTKNKLYQQNFSNDIVINDALYKNDQLALLYKINEEELNTYINIYNVNTKEIVEKLHVGSNTINTNLIDTSKIIIFSDSLKEITLKSIKVYNFGVNQIKSKDDSLSLTSVYIEGKKVEVDQNKSILNVDYNLFGTYDVLYYFSGNELDLMYKKDVIVSNNISVSNNNTYDLNTILTFNGRGLLNNESIIPGYTLDKCGEYKLQVYGKDNLMIEIDFTVDKLSVNILNNDEKKDKNYLSDSMVKDSIIEPKEKLGKSVTAIDSSNIEQSKKYILWPLLIPSAILVFGSVFIIWVNKK